MAKVLFIEQYSAYYFVVRGETVGDLSKRSTKLRELGGLFRETLLDKTGSTYQGWLFLRHKEKSVTDWVNWINYYHNEKVNHSHLRQYL